MSLVYGAPTDEQSDWQNEIQIILEWFYYHYALSRFATRHWNHKVVNRTGMETVGNYLQKAKLDIVSLKLQKNIHMIISVLLISRIGSKIISPDTRSSESV